MSHWPKKSKRRSAKGIALLMVLASLAILSSLVVEFAYNSNVTYNLALNQKDRVQAYYLAESALNFSKLILRFDKEAQKLAGEASNKLGRTIQVQPLYEMIPLNSEILRGVAQLEGGAAPEGEEGAGEAPEGSPAAEALGGFNLKGAESFLAFEGNFSSEIGEEDAKLNVNAFFNLQPTNKSYERLKSTLYHLLLTDEFAGMFDDKFRGAKDLAQNIADYIDKDDAQNEPGGQERGREGVGGGTQVTMKNAKLLSIEELMMVPGLTEDIFQKLKPYLTVYSPDEKIFVCRAKDPLVKSMILAYTENNSRMEPVRDDNAEMLTKAADAVLNSCPDIQAMANNLDQALGVVQPESNPSEGGGTGGSKGPTSTLTGATSGGGGLPGQSDTFTNMVKNENKIFSVIGIGTVGETEVKLKTVLDTTNPNPNRWVMLYWRVE